MFDWIGLQVGGVSSTSHWDMERPILESVGSACLCALRIASFHQMFSSDGFMMGQLWQGTDKAGSALQVTARVRDEEARDCPKKAGMLR